MSTFATAILNPEAGLRFYLKIQGIPYIFLAGETPVGPAGTAWSAPTSKGFPFTLKPNLLDVSEGIRDIGADISRRTAVTDPGSLTLTLADVGRDGFLRGLFARDLAGALTATLTADLAYDTTGAGNTITVDDTTGWPASGTGYLGRETVQYGSKTGTTFVCTDAAGGKRDVYSLGSEDTVYRQNNSGPSGPRLIATTPRVWHGRYVQLYAFVVDQDGRAYDSTFDGAHSREVFRGVIQGDPRLRGDWRSWTLECRSIDAILATEVGRDTLVGQLVRVPGNAKQNTAGSAGDDGWPPDAVQTLLLLDENTRYLDLDITEWASAAAKVAGTINAIGSYHITIASAGTIWARAALKSLLTTQVDSTISGTFPKLVFDFQTTKQPIGITNNEATKVYQVGLRFGQAGSVGPLLGFHSDVQADLGGQSFKLLGPDGPQLAAYVHPNAPTIPFFPTPTEGQYPDLPTAPGYVRIGDEELVYYTDLSSLGANLDGMYQLTGCQRGAFGTVAKEHAVELNPDWTAKQSEVKLTFGVGFDNVSLFDAFLQLAISTGSAHHGSKDVLAAKVSPGLNPQHFDTSGIAALKAGIPAGLHTIRLFMSKPKKLHELLADWLAPLGCYVTARTADSGLFKITIDRIVPALESGGEVVIDTTRIDAEEAVTWRQGNDQLINEIAVEYRWDLVKEEAAEGEPAIWIDHDSAYDYGVRNRIEWHLRGYPWTPADALANLPELCKTVSDRFGHPYDVLEVRVDRQGWLVNPGDTVRLTVPGMPGPDGAIGVTSRAAVVIGVRRDFWAPGGSTGATLVVLLERYVRQSTYAPAAKVSAYNAGVPSITLSDHEYTAADGAALDSDFFVNGDVVRIWNQGDATTIDIRTLSAKSGSTFTLSGTLTNCTWGADTRMTHADYSAVQASQRKRVFIADNTAKGGLSVSDATGFKYV